MVIRKQSLLICLCLVLLVITSGCAKELSQEQMIELLERAEDKLLNAEWIIATQEYATPNSESLRLIYREHRPSGTIWYTLLAFPSDSGDHYLIRNGECYFSNQKNITRQGMHGATYLLPSYNLYDPPDSNAWQKIDRLPEIPQVIFPFDAFISQIGNSENVSFYDDKRILGIGATVDVKDGAWYSTTWRYSVNLDLETAECLSFMKTKDFVVFDYYRYTYDEPFIIPTP